MKSTLDCGLCFAREDPCPPPAVGLPAGVGVCLQRKEHSGVELTTSVVITDVSDTPEHDVPL